MKKGMLICVASVLLACSPASAQSKLDNMISPISNPVQFEDPRPSTELRPIYMYHKMPSDFVTGGGNVQLYALQARYAVNERLAIIATKDGFVDFNPDDNLTNQEGAANLAGGLKYAFYRDDELGRILTTGLRYEAATGSPEVFQGEGDGMINPLLTGAMVAGPVNLMAMTQMRIAVNDQDSTFWDVALHADYPINDFYPTVELNMVEVANAGNRIGLNGEGFDVVNFGSTGADGETTVTMAVGSRYRATKDIDLGLAYEYALTDNEDIFDWRITTDVIFRLPL
jgi:opacity protein-like surface antigen